MNGCPKCGGLMVAEGANDFYMHIEFARCVICGKRVETAVHEYAVRPEEEEVNA